MSVPSPLPKFSALIPLLVVAALAASVGARHIRAAESSEEVRQQVDEDKLSSEIYEKVRKQIAEAVHHELELARNKTTEERGAGKEESKSTDKASSETDGNKSRELHAREKNARDDDDATAQEVRRLRNEVELQEARFKHRVAMYEKDLEKQRLSVEKAKIDRKLLSDVAVNEQLSLQRELERVKLEVELQKKQVEGEQLRVDAELAKSRAEKAAIEQSLQTEDFKEKLDERVLGEEEYPDQPFEDGVLTISLRRIELNGPIFDGAADYVCQRLDYYNNQSDKPIFLVIDDCPGGSAIQGFQIVQAIRKSKAPVHVVVKRMAASMGAIIATLADHSYCYPDSLILHHQASTYVTGTGRDIEDQMRQYKQISHRLIGAVAKKLGLSEKEFVNQMYKNRASGDWELFGDEAVENGWIDHVATTIREQGVRNKPKGMRNPASFFLIVGEGAPQSASSQGYLERYEVQLPEEVDKEGTRFIRLPRLSPLDAYLLYNPDGYYR